MLKWKLKILPSERMELKPYKEYLHFSDHHSQPLDLYWHGYQYRIAPWCTGISHRYNTLLFNKLILVASRGFWLWLAEILIQCTTHSICSDRWCYLSRVSQITFMYCLTVGSHDQDTRVQTESYFKATCLVLAGIGLFWFLMSPPYSCWLTIRIYCPIVL